MKIQAQVGTEIHDVTIEQHDGLFTVELDGTRHVVDAKPLEGDFFSILINGTSYEISVEPDGDAYHVRHGASAETVRLVDPSRVAREALIAEGEQHVATVMPGKISRVLVEEGDEVEAGQGLVVVEAMKMENEIASPKAGRVTSVRVRPGQAVESGATLVVVE